MEYVHKDVFGTELNVTEAARYLRNNENTIKTYTGGHSGRKKEFEHFFGKGCYISTFVRDPWKCRVITSVNICSFDVFYIRSVTYWIRFLSTQEPKLLAIRVRSCSFSGDDLRSASRFFLFPSILIKCAFHLDNAFCVSEAMKLLQIKSIPGERQNC